MQTRQGLSSNYRLYGSIGTVSNQYEVEGRCDFLARWYRGNTSWLSFALNQDFFYLEE